MMPTTTGEIGHRLLLLLLCLVCVSQPAAQQPIHEQRWSLVPQQQPADITGERVSLISGQTATHKQIITLGNHLDVKLEGLTTSISCSENSLHQWKAPGWGDGALVVSHPELAQALNTLAEQLRLGDPLAFLDQSALALTFLPTYGYLPPSHDRLVSVSAQRNSEGLLEIHTEYQLEKLRRGAISPCHPLRNVYWIANSSAQHPWIIMAWDRIPYASIIALLTSVFTASTQGYADGLDFPRVVVTPGREARLIAESHTGVITGQVSGLDFFLGQPAGQVVAIDGRIDADLQLWKDQRTTQLHVWNEERQRQYDQVQAVIEKLYAVD